MTHVVVTGATSGIGEAIARRLAEESTVTLIGRDPDRLVAARERIASSVAGADLPVECVDLAELAQVRALVDRLLAGPPPDVVISSAALVAALRRTTSDGLPPALAVNHLAPYLLLRSVAENCERVRLIVISSDPVLLATAPVDLDDLLFTRPAHLGDPVELRSYQAYIRTKSMNAMFVRALARRTAGTAVTTNCCHPGLVPGTGLLREEPGLQEVLRKARRAGAPSSAGLRTPERGADTPVWLATSLEASGVSGSFFVDREVVEVPPHIEDLERCERLWDASAALVGLPP